MVDDPYTWLDLTRLYKSIGRYDLVQSIASNMISGLHDLTRKALMMESQACYMDAIVLYEQVRCCQSFLPFN